MTKDIKVLTPEDIKEIFKISRMTLYRWLHTDPSFPRPIHLTKRKIVFRSEAIEEWMRSKENQQICE